MMNDEIPDLTRRLKSAIVSGMVTPTTHRKLSQNPHDPVYPSNLWLWRSVVNLAEAQLIAERSASGEVFPISYADAELARMISEEEIREARLDDDRALQSLTNFIVLGNG